MKTKKPFLTLAAAMLVSAVHGATTYFVDLNSTNAVSPFGDWSTAATNIQDAIDAASAGDLVLVTNGIYETGGRAVYGTASNRVVLDKALTVQSARGAASTMIVGVYTPPAGSGPNVRCAYLTNGAVLSGFTLASGGTPPVLSDQVREASGGGVWCESSNASLVNCILIGNTSGYSGGGVFSGTLTQCVLASNAVVGGRGWGGGAWSSTLRNCVLTGNNGYEGGGAASSRLNNCLLVQNTATYGGGAFSSTLNNCTIVSNSATYNGGGIAGGSADAFATNCIVYYNSAPSSSNWSVGNLAFSCTQPLPGGTGNFTNEPVFTSLAAGDFHPQSNSPCINAGWNPAVSSTTDLDGKPRVVGGTVDIGAYEFQSPSSLLSYAWALQYGLPTDGSADFLDSDGDGMSNWQEWIAGSNPTNATSALIMSSPVTNAVGLQISWQSANGKLYYLQRATNLAASPAFSSIRSNIYGRIGTTIFIDNSATNPGPYFYRVGVQQ